MGVENRGNFEEARDHPVGARIRAKIHPRIDPSAHGIYAEFIAFTDFISKKRITITNNVGHTYAVKEITFRSV